MKNKKKLKLYYEAIDKKAQDMVVKIARLDMKLYRKRQKLNG